MSSFRLIAAATLLLGASALLTGAAANPGAQMKDLEDMAARAGVGSAVIRTASCHRRPNVHWVYRWGVRAWHVHVGPNCAPRRFNPYRGRGRPPGWRRRGCLQVGPVWYCP